MAFLSGKAGKLDLKIGRGGVTGSVWVYVGFSQAVVLVRRLLIKSNKARKLRTSAPYLANLPPFLPTLP